MKKSDLEETFDSLIQLHQPWLFPIMHEQYRFHSARRWKADRAWPHAMVLVELDGGTWTRGYHTSGAGYDKDSEKHMAAMSMGYIVVRLSTSMLAPERAHSFLSLLSHLVSSRALVADQVVQTIPRQPPAETFESLTPARAAPAPAPARHTRRNARHNRAAQASKEALAIKICARF